MKPERWQQIEQLYHSALEREGGQRLAFLADACAGDDSLRREVESLLGHHTKAESLLETPAMEVAAKVLADDQTNSLVGQRLGPYQILSLLGAGGMGEVYRAQDTKLDRTVALKLLPVEIAKDEERMQRFVREAKAASALNHPHVATIYEIGEASTAAGSMSFIAMEYVEGQTLAAKINGHPLATSEIVEIGSQIADALDAAHSKGIIHRDIKPQNIMLNERGQVKVLDFGLAKITRPTDQAASSAVSALAKTAPGIVMGTIPYMSPEQALEQDVDQRSDLFSLGVVIYEMSTGRRPFDGQTWASTFDAILHRAPDSPSRFNPDVPAELEQIIAKMLEKDREARYQTAADLLADLKRLHRALDGRQATTVSSTSAREEPRLGRNGWRLTAVLAAGLLFVLVALWYLLPHPDSGTKEMPTALRIGLVTRLTDQPGQELFPSLSPDGKSFVYASGAAGNGDIYLQRVGGKNPINLTKDSSAEDTEPAFSPDGEQIAFRSDREGGGVFVMGATGENVKRLTDFGHNPAWSPDGKEIAFAKDAVRLWSNTSQIWAVNLLTGAKRPITKMGTVQPNWSPHNHRIAYVSNRNLQRSIWTVPANGGEPIPVVNDAHWNWNPVWSPDGHYLYFASTQGGSGNLWRVPIEESSGKVLGPPEPVTTPSPDSAHIAISREGRHLAYVQQISNTNLYRVAFDPATEKVIGRPVPITQGSRQYTHPNLSPDGQWLAFDSRDVPVDIFVSRADGTGLRQLTNDAYVDRFPRWSPDGKRVAFMSDRRGKDKAEVWLINADGSGLQQLTYTSGVITAGAIWSPDGKRILYSRGVASPCLIEVGKPWQEQSPQTLPPMSEPNAVFRVRSWSPDGRRLAGFQEGSRNIVIYFFESHQYEKLGDLSGDPVWLSDSRRLLFNWEDKIFLLDSQSKKVHEVLSVAPQQVDARITLSQDNRQIYFGLIATEADIWLMTLGEKAQ